MAFKDYEFPNPLVTKSCDNQADNGEIISDDDWDSEADEGLTMEDLLNQFNLTAADEPQDSMEEESTLTKVQKTNQQFERENIVFKDS